MTQSEGVARTDAAMIGLVWQVMLLLVERLVVGYTGHFGSMGTRMGEEGTCQNTITTTPLHTSVLITFPHSFG
jgi:hypothetical protein